VAPGGSRGRTGADTAALAPAAGAAGPEYRPYLQAFRRRVQESLEYPLAARRQRAEGAVELEVILDPSGRVAQVRVVSPSGQPLLDEAALEAVRRIAPLPIPGHLPQRALRIRLPLVFQLR
jgi:protein TonB